MAEPVLRVAGLRRAFGALVAVDGVTLDLRRGEIHALIGPNGAGKSTLMRLIAGEMPADAGTVELDGRDIGGLDAAGRARAGLARSFQISSVFPEFSVLQNVVLAATGGAGAALSPIRGALADPALTAHAREAIARAALEGREAVAAAALSHGERRRLEIAMALALRPRAFLLDEPMAGMGPDGTRALTALLSGLRTEAPILLVEHDMDAVFALADRISVLVYGRVLATGTVDEIRRDPEVQRAYLGDAA
jgi:branched-chain amino acid transport system ATP-binding protein